MKIQIIISGGGTASTLMEHLLNARSINMLPYSSVTKFLSIIILLLETGK
jgi:hypothetical protein